MTGLLRVFGVDDLLQVGDFEYKAPLSVGNYGFIDCLWKGKLAIEMKSKGKDIALAFRQLEKYMRSLPPDEVPDLWLACDFARMRLSRRSTGEIWDFKTKDLHRHVSKFAAVAGYPGERAHESQVEVNVKAAEKMARLHDALKSSGYVGHELEACLVRLLFCLFADDTGIFPQG
ncbi:MAG: class I SAM-dependent DNA methyltransferase, partial [Deltaproteobacteria bacterium]|nr:class I SAM-dependent DNA methyltransferase [Deltaproteobacteria bacterium]